ncbi:hypothetical protein FQN60_011223 [Etheostoma spectabile]|uniref:mitogen-activated protein kinase kinase n=1 Tax=Etheostoma spectabile TaxID=54343 RepID=A0A5J5DRK2_9PERO|nr:hypothetical protein FQN60_011223 [Etheostoma spectabile]
MDTEAIEIRIKTPSGDMDSVVDCPSLLNFNDLLVAIRDVMPEATVTAFEYEDEVGDRITVRSDEELKAMLSYYFNTMNEQRMNGLLPDPLQIFPRAGKTPGIRNIHGLKINAQDIHYQEQLGHGNGGTVYKAYHLLGKRVLAVKVIPLDITVELQKQIMSELEILYKCDSPYIITFFSAFFVENRISICTEFMDGSQRPDISVEPEDTSQSSIKQFVSADVKPSNMLVNTRGQVKLCDFGVSTQLVNSIAKTYVGTNAYMAPERISGEQYGIHADVWSVGISFMELALGMFPYPQVSKEQLKKCINGNMRRQPKERPAPNNLMMHPFALSSSFLLKDHSFITQFNDGNAEVVSMWVCRCLEERRAQHAPGHV